MCVLRLVRCGCCLWLYGMMAAPVAGVACGVAGLFRPQAGACFSNRPFFFARGRFERPLSVARCILRWIDANTVLPREDIQNLKLGRQFVHSLRTILYATVLMTTHRSIPAPKADTSRRARGQMSNSLPIARPTRVLHSIPGLKKRCSMSVFFQTPRRWLRAS